MYPLWYTSKTKGNKNCYKFWIRPSEKGLVDLWKKERDEAVEKYLLQFIEKFIPKSFFYSVNDNTEGN